MRFTNMLRGKNALITGGSRGLGRALCLEFARQGCNIAFVYATDDEGARETLRQLENFGIKALSIQASVLDKPRLDKTLLDLEKHFNQLDILVNNAGISQPLPFAFLDEEDWDKVMDVNVKGYFLVTHAVVPIMIHQRSGVILNIGSLAGLRLIEAPAHYSASKAAIKGLTEALCKELGRYNIRVNCLAPGLLEEGVGSNLPEHRVAKYISHVALKRLGKLDEVAKFAAFLVSDRNTYMSGETIIMDGGL